MFADKWEPATAVVVAVNVKGGDAESGAIHEYVLDVTPDSGATPFRTELRDPMQRQSFNSPRVGRTVIVKADVKHQKVKWDDPSLDLKAKWKEEKDEYKASAAGDVGAAPVSGRIEPVPGEDPRLHLLRVRAQTAQTTGDPAELARVQEMIRRVESGEAPMPGAAAAPDPLDRIKKLADLHAAGALTDKEFAEQKAKILDQT